jgi:hypothetical protein
MNPEMETVDRSVHLMLPRTDSANPPFVSSTLRSTEGSIRKGPILGSKLNGVDACSVRSLILTAANAHTPGDDPQSVIAAEFGVTLISRRTAMMYANRRRKRLSKRITEGDIRRQTSSNSKGAAWGEASAPNRDHVHVDELIRGLHRERRCRGVGGRSGEPRDTDRDESEEKRAA